MSTGRDRAAAAAAAEPDPLPHFRRGPGDPMPPSGVVGVWIGTEGLEGPSNARCWPLHGTFQVPRSLRGAEESAEAVLGRIVLTLRYGSTHDIQARPAFRDELLFPEDVQQIGELVVGFFHLDLLRTFKFIAPEDSYFIGASIGEHLSDVISCTARMPWLIPPPAEASAEDDEEEAEEEEEEAALEEDEEDDDPNWMVDDPF